MRSAQKREREAFLVIRSRPGLVKLTILRLWVLRSGRAPFTPPTPGCVLCLFPNLCLPRAAAVHGGSPGGHLVQHGPDESARLRPQAGFPDEHAGRGKGGARARGQAGQCWGPRPVSKGAWAILSRLQWLLEAGLRQELGEGDAGPAFGEEV